MREKELSIKYQMEEVSKLHEKVSDLREDYETEIEKKDKKVFPFFLLLAIFAN